MAVVLLSWFMTLLSVAMSFALPYTPWMMIVYILAMLSSVLSVLVTIVSMEELRHEKN